MATPSPSRNLSYAWVAVLLAALVWQGWSDLGRARHARYVSNLDRENAVVDAASPTGYASGRRWWIAPEHHSRTYQWLAETEQMLARESWRIRSIDYENAPLGREVHSAAPYHAWLAAITRLVHALTGSPLGICLEQTALWADPLLHGILLLVTTLLVARYFGSGSAMIAGGAIVFLFPFAATFLPGVVDSQGLAEILALWSVLPLLIGFYQCSAVPASAITAASVAGAQPSPGRASRRPAVPTGWFVAGGVIGGIGLWNSAGMEVPFILGIGAGGVLASLLKKKNDPTACPSAWRMWALGGATTCLLSYIIEYAPDHFGFHLEVNHPLYGLSWLGLGELLFLIERWRTEGGDRSRLRTAGNAVLGLAAMAALPITRMVTKSDGFLTGDTLATRLTSLPNGAVAPGLVAWLRRDGLSGEMAATLLPLLVFILGVVLLLRRAAPGRNRINLALTIGPAAVTLFFALSHLREWSSFDTALLGLAVAIAAFPAEAVRPMARRLGWLLAGTVVVTGALQLAPSALPSHREELSRLDVESLLERGLAHWLADRIGEGATVLAPPDRAPGLWFHGGLKGIGTPNWENQAGLAATIRIVCATTVDEAYELMTQRGINSWVLPSWDSDLDDFARWSMTQPNDSFIHAVRHWAIPPWLRPIPYKLPTIPGFETQSVLVFRITDEMNRAAGLSRLAEYFLETGQSDLANAAGDALQPYPTDLPALIARAQVAKARGDTDSFEKIFASLAASVTNAPHRPMPWDQRVSLAVVLAQGNRNDLSRPQVERCLKDMTPARIRSLTTASLFRLQVLARAFDLPIADASQRALALRLLPVELRDKI